MDTQLEQQFGKLQQSLSQLFMHLDQVPEELMSKCVEEGKWSVLQVMHHVMMAEKGSLAYMRKKLQHFDDRKPPKAGFRELIRSFALTTFLMSPFKAKSPERIAAFPEQINYNELKITWLQTRKELDAFLEELPNEVLELALYKHPIAGRLNVSQCLNFFQSHFNRHRKQIDRIVSKQEKLGV